MLKNKWSCTKLIGGGGVQKSYTRTDPKIAIKIYYNRYDVGHPEG